MKKGVMVFLCLVLAGCVNFVESPDSKVSGDALDIPLRDFRVDFRRGRFLVSGSKVGIGDVVRSLAGYGVRIVCSEDIDRTVSLDIDGEFTVLEVMRMIEVKFCCRASKSGDVWILENNVSDEKSGSSVVGHGKRVLGGGSSSSDVNGSLGSGGYVYFFRVWGFSDEEVLQRLGSYNVVKLGNSVYYSRGDLLRIMELDSIVMQMMACVPVQYYFTVWFVSEDVLRDIGLKTDLSAVGSVGRVFSRVPSRFDYRLAVDAVVDSSFDLSNKKGVRRMGGVVREGSEFSFRLGDDIPMAKRSVSDQGTVSDTGYEYQRFGFSVTVKVEGRSFGIVTLNLENTDIGGYVGDYPVRHGSTLNTVLQIGDGGRVYVGSCLMDSDTRGFFTFRKQRQYYHVILQCDLIEAGKRVDSLYELK